MLTLTSVTIWLAGSKLVAVDPASLVGVKLASLVVVVPALLVGVKLASLGASW